MSQYTVIADVGMTLIQLLRDHMVPELVQQPEYIGLASPVDKGDLVISLYLFKIEEESERQTQMVARGPGSLQYPPMSVRLHYLITAHSNAELLGRSLDEHRLLGKVMQTIYDNSLLANSSLQGGLSGSNEELKIVMETVPLETLINLFPNMPYKLSVSYSVGPVYIDSNRIRTTKRVLERDFKIQG